MIEFKKYGWKRYYHKIDIAIPLTDEGYLMEYEVMSPPYGDILLTRSQLNSNPCTIILGEPGIGKSTEMRLSFDGASSGGKPSFFIELGFLGNHETIHREILQNPKLINWLKEKGELYVFLDGLDECLDLDGSAAAYLIREISSLPKEGLHLQISCRKSEWNQHFYDLLTNGWGTDHVSIYELAPLTRIDVRRAAEVEGEDPSTFLEFISNNGADSIAARPIGLRLLLNSYRQNVEISNCTSIFQNGCRYLCEETNILRKAIKKKGSLTPQNRLNVAARMAALMLLSNQRKVVEHLDQAGDGKICFNDVAGNEESANGQIIQISEKEIEETLTTALFTRHELGFVWAHHSFAEFLCASYLVDHRVEDTQIISLITFNNGRILPWLYGTVAWLAILRKDIYDYVLRHEPEIFIGQNIGTLTDSDRQWAIDSLLQAINEQHTRRVTSVEYLGKLKHHGIGKQISQWLNDNSLNQDARLFAIDVSYQCNVHEVKDILLRIALDKSIDVIVRTHAAFCLRHVGDLSTVAQLRPLVFEVNDQDVTGSLKAEGLKAVWPGNVTVEELFSTLTSPENDTIGEYYVYVTNQLPNSLTADDMPYALEWAQENNGMDEEWKDELIDSILLRSFDFLENPVIAEKSAYLATQRLESRVSILIHQGYEKFRRGIPLSKKLKLAYAIAKVIGANYATRIIDSQTPLMDNSCLDEAIMHFKESINDNENEVWARLIIRLLDPMSPEQLSLIYSLAKQNSILMQQYEAAYGPIMLDSKIAKDLKEHYDWINSNYDLKPIDQNPKQRVHSRLDAFESGNLDAWCVLNRDLTLTPTSHNYGDELSADLISLPGWIEASPIDKERILKAAKRYILEYQVDSPLLITDGKFDRTAAAGFRALILIQQQDPGFLKSIPISQWEQWIPVIVNCPFNFGDQLYDYALAITECAYRQSPESFITYFGKRVREESMTSEHPSAINYFMPLIRAYEEPFIEMITLQICLTDTNTSYLEETLTLLISIPNKDALELTSNILYSVNSPRQRRIAAASALMVNTDPHTWEKVWHLFREDIQFGKEVFSNISQKLGVHVPICLNNLLENQLEDLYLWLCNQYPPENDPQLSDFTSSIGKLIHLRKMSINELSKRGTSTACQRIVDIQKKFPNQKYLSDYIIYANEQAAIGEWTPPTPGQIIDLVKNSKKRIIRNAEDLQHAIIESISRLEEKMHGETPASYDLWNEVPCGHYKKYTPKDENALSDYIKRHFDEDLSSAISTRESEIRRGEFTDIHVDTIIGQEQGNPRKISVIIEVKGCWNNELLKNLKAQLVERYLKGNACSNGIYLAGWYRCVAWDKEDYRKSMNSNLVSKENLLSLLQKQAEEELIGGYNVIPFVLDATIRSRSVK